MAKIITKQELDASIKAGVKNLVTKQQMDAAIKAGVKNLATKQELDASIRAATKKMATKQELAKLRGWVVENAVTKTEFYAVMEKVATKQDYDKLINMMDEAMTELRDARWDRESFTHQFLRMDDSVADHEKRIRVLERPQSVS